MSAYKGNRKPSLHGTVDDFSADRTQGLLHRILLPHTPRAGKMHIPPATVTTLPHCETGYLAAYVCGNRTQGLLHRLLLPHTPRAGKMHISPATVTTLPHCETGYLAAYGCGKTEMSFYKANKAFFTRNR